MSREKRSRSRGCPEFGLEESSPVVFKTRCGWSHSFNRIHQPVRYVRDTGIGLLIEPVSVMLHSDVHLPPFHSYGHQIRLVIIKEFAPGGFFSLSRPIVQVVVAVKMNLV